MNLIGRSEGRTIRLTVYAFALFCGIYQPNGEGFLSSRIRFFVERRDATECSVIKSDWIILFVRQLKIPLRAHCNCTHTRPCSRLEIYRERTRAAHAPAHAPHTTHATMSNVTDDDDKIVKNSWTPEVRSTRRRETFSRRRRRHSGPRPTTVRKSFSSVTTVLNRSGLRALGAPTRPILAHETPDDVDLLTNTEHPYPNSAGGCAPSRADPEARGPGQLDRYRRGSARSLEQELSSEVSPARPPSSSISSRTPRIADRGSARVCRTHRRFARSFPALSGTPRRAPSAPPRLPVF